MQCFITVILLFSIEEKFFNLISKSFIRIFDTEVLREFVIIIFEFEIGFVNIKLNISVKILIPRKAHKYKKWRGQRFCFVGIG